MLTLRGHTGRVHGVAYSPDGTRLASAGDDKAVRVWDAATGKELLAFEGHNSRVYCVAFGPKGDRVASGDDRNVRSGMRVALELVPGSGSVVGIRTRTPVP